LKGRKRGGNATQRDSLLQPSKGVKSTLSLRSSSNVVVVEVEIDPRRSEIIPRPVSGDKRSIDPVRVLEENGRIGHLPGGRREMISSEGEREIESEKEGNNPHSVVGEVGPSAFWFWKEIDASVPGSFIRDSNLKGREVGSPSSVENTVSFSNSGIVAIGPWKAKKKGRREVS